jgi:hypothetical protein
VKKLPLLVLLMLAAAGAGILAACGGSGDPSANPSPTSYAECLQQQGVTIPSGRATDRPTARPSGSAQPRPSGTAFPRPSGSGGPGNGQFGQGNEAMQKAMQACANLRPSGGANGGGNQEALTAYVNCLKDKGITWNPGDPTPTAEAAKVCEVLRPSRPATN